MFSKSSRARCPTASRQAAIRFDCSPLGANAHRVLQVGGGVKNSFAKAGGLFVLYLTQAYEARLAGGQTRMP
jgi:hypothetical protein